MAEQYQDTIAHDSEERKPRSADGVDGHPVLGAVGGRARWESSPSPMKEDAASDLSTELGSDGSDESVGDSESPDVVMGEAFSAEETLFIFDWDDTLLPTTWVQRQGLSLDAGSVPTDEQRGQLQRAAECSRRTLQGAMQRGRVVIVTNGGQGWVELSCSKFMPSLAPVLVEVQIVSARATYEPQGIACPFEWKVHAFKKEIYGFYSGSGADVRRNVLSLGDSMHEHLALASVTQGMSNCRAKSLKFATFPELERLVEQHELVSGRLDDIVDHDGDLSLEVSPSRPCQEVEVLAS